MGSVAWISSAGPSGSKRRARAGEIRARPALDQPRIRSRAVPAERPGGRRFPRRRVQASRPGQIMRPAAVGGERSRFGALAQLVRAMDKRARRAGTRRALPLESNRPASPAISRSSRSQHPRAHAAPILLVRRLWAPDSASAGPRSGTRSLSAPRRQGLEGYPLALAWCFSPVVELVDQEALMLRPPCARALLGRPYQGRSRRRRGAGKSRDGPTVGAVDHPDPCSMS